MLNRANYTPPAEDEIEVSLFGPGYGECVVIHTGSSEWMIVDSCVSDNGPVALEYFNAMEIDPAVAVKLVTATHWHDDHIRGLAQVVEATPNARFACSSALQTREFITLTQTSEDPMMASSGVDEFRQIFSILSRPRAARPADHAFALADRVLYRRSGVSEVEIVALTPSDAAFEAALVEIARLLPARLAPKRRVSPVGPNHASVVLWLRIGSTQILLGADLQVVPGGHWAAILSSSARPAGRASVFKVPHHGSSNGDHPEVWTELVEPNPIAMLTPFVRGSVALPTAADQARLCGRSSRTYITAAPERRRAARRDRTVQKMIQETVQWIGEANPPFGHVRARLRIGESLADWRVDTYGPAHLLCAWSSLQHG